MRQKKSDKVQKTSVQKERNEEDDTPFLGFPDPTPFLGFPNCTPLQGFKDNTPFLGFPDPNPKVHHVSSYSILFNKKISVQSKLGPAGEMIDIVDGFTFMSFSSEKEMLSYDGTYSGTSTKMHRRWLKKKRRRRKKLVRLKGTRKAYQKRVQEAATPSVVGSAVSPRKEITAGCGSLARSVPLSSFVRLEVVV